MVINENEDLNNLFQKNKKLISVSNSNYNPNFSKLSYLTEKFKIQKTNVINLARVNRKALAEKRYEIYKNFYNKKIDTNTIYLIENFSHLQNLQSIFKDDFYFYKIDNILLMTSSNEHQKVGNKLQFVNFKKINLNYNYKFNNDLNDNFLGLGWSYNNMLIKKINFEFNKTNNNLLKFELKKELITNNNIELRFYFKNPGSPSDYSESPDSKKLGILLKNIFVKEKII